MISRRGILVGAVAFVFETLRVSASAEIGESNPLWSIPQARHEEAMQRAIGLASFCLETGK